MRFEFRGGTTVEHFPAVADPVYSGSTPDVRDNLEIEFAAAVRSHRQPIGERFDLQRRQPVDQLRRRLRPPQRLLGQHLPNEPGHASWQMGGQHPQVGGQLVAMGFRQVSRVVRVNGSRPVSHWNSVTPRL